MTQPPEIPPTGQVPPPPPPVSYGGPYDTPSNTPGAPMPPVGYGQSPYPMQPGQMMPGQAPVSGLYKAAAIINWVVMGLMCLTIVGIIVCAWFIPMTIRIQKGAKDRYSHTALGVCTLLFCNLISGILILVDSGNRQPRPQI